MMDDRRRQKRLQALAFAATFINPDVPAHTKLGQMYGLIQGPDEDDETFIRRIEEHVAMHHGHRP